MKTMKKLALLPNLFTLGNGLCGFIAILYIVHYAVSETDAAGGVGHDFRFLVIASWLIMLGMFFDGVDGKIARMTGSTSEFGMQLDSLCDAVTFGVAPALMVATLHMGTGHPYWERVVWFFSVAYASCALMRLARYNVEQGKPDEKYHMEFKGVPSPAAGGLIATYIILTGYLQSGGGERAHDLRTLVGSGFCNDVAIVILVTLPFIVAALAYLMVSSRIHYIHFLNNILKGKQTFDYFSYVILGGILLFFFREMALALVFTFYVMSGVVIYFWRSMLGRDTSGSAPEHANLVLIGLGSNMGYRRKNLRAAVRLLRENAAVTVLRKSNFYRTKPAGGPRKQRKYLNGAALIKTSLKPRGLLDTLHEIEDELGRERRERWGPRTIDLDILLYGNLIIREDDLQVPHPRMHERRFALLPAMEIAPDMVHPTLRLTVSELYKKLRSRTRERTA
jgi:2-amino-4-hydroxy-6-hydroxymethyldihydropteridine diphosphokinase/CDP-diacylglycerol--serine O-phosphatidyltransferase